MSFTPGTTRTFGGSPRRRGLRTWLRSVFRSPVHVGADLPELLTVHRTTTISLETPARGGGFMFHLDIRCDWCAEGRHDEAALQRSIDTYQEGLSDRLADRIRKPAQEHEPYRVEDAERAVNAVLADGECFENGLVRCATLARVQPAPEVRDREQEAALRRQQIEHEYDLSRLRVRRLREVSAHWRDFLAEGLVTGIEGGADGTRTRALTPHEVETLSWTTPWAVLLAERPQEAAVQVARMFDERTGQVQLFIDYLSAQTKAYQQMDIFDFVVTNEEQLGRAMKVFGMPMPGGPTSRSGPPEPLPRFDER
ncbi:hypothetical protein [Embleya sp. NPDC020886]|uniref:hypothetical protein n=1 Tax=Embleya sp. NPDC020886 TaxID=3363980 RepID=UPI0037BCC69B